MTNAPDNLIQALRAGARFVLTSHINPDGDAVGSEIGLARILRSLGKGAVIWNRDPCPKLYLPLPGSDGIHQGEEPPKGFPDAFDAAVVLECPSLDRTGLADHFEGLTVLNIDHHLKNEHFGQANWIDTSAPSLGEMIHRLARALNVNIDENTATSLFLTLVTDTGGFRFANATERAFEAAAQLVRDGARPQEVARWLYESQPETSLRLLAEVLRTLEVTEQGKVATVLLTREMSERAGSSPGDSEGLIDYPRSIAGVEAVAMIRELEDCRCKVSLRSRGSLDVERIARRHGGGGHRNAAGFTAEGGCAELRQTVAAQLGRALEELE